MKIHENLRERSETDASDTFLVFFFNARFNKIRVDPTTGLVHRDDFQFAKTEGNPVRFARAGDCFSAASKCQKGKFQMDLSGTGLRMRKDVDWEAWGTPKVPQRLLSVRKAEDGTMAYGECGGSCGGCQPIKERMFVEPAACTDPSTTGEYSSIGKDVYYLLSQIFLIA